MTSNLQKCAEKLFPEDMGQRRAFVDALERGAAKDHTAVIMLWDAVSSDFDGRPGHDWHPDWVVKAGADSDPGKLESHRTGSIYLLDMSSVFAASVLQACTFQAPPIIYDLCASPGGKSVFAWKLFGPRMIVANEVVQKRIPALISNLKRCGISPAMVTSRDPAFFSSRCPGAADLVLVDAPCSGQSLIVKGEESRGCFHPATINMNSNRQKRIIANAAALAREGAYVCYMTCTFSAEENEKVARWFLKRFPEFQPVSCPALSRFQSTLSEIPCYRIWPQSGIGAGAFTALFKRTGESEPASLSSLEVLTPLYRLDG